ncbi:MAG: hypothetical protein QXN59_00375 [Candidatus Micrarchaeaceae archaeon]
MGLWKIFHPLYRDTNLELCLLAVAFPIFSILSELQYVRSVLYQVGPALSAVLFIIAGIFYAVGQMLPPDKRANFHTTAVNIIIGAIIVAVLSFTSTSLAVASTHLLSNFTNSS